MSSYKGAQDSQEKTLPLSYQAITKRRRLQLLHQSSTQGMLEEGLLPTMRKRPRHQMLPDTHGTNQRFRNIYRYQNRVSHGSSRETLEHVLPHL